MPLEQRTVRFLDNFSTGTRGAASCEHFLRHGCNVIFLHRRGSLCPFVRHVQAATSRHFDLALLDRLELRQDTLSLTLSQPSTEHTAIASAFALRARSRSRLLSLPFSTVSSYLCLAAEVCSALRPVSSRSLLFLACAVSDFYIPARELATDKIQSADSADSDGFTLRLRNTPKMLGLFKRLSGAESVMVSFKLETKRE